MEPTNDCQQCLFIGIPCNCNKKTANMSKYQRKYYLKRKQQKQQEYERKLQERIEKLKQSLI